MKKSIKKTVKQSKRNVYSHEIDLTPLRIENQSKEEFHHLLEKIKYRGYEVEQLEDGRKIVVTKPGGKFTFGTVKRDDFMVWIYNPTNNTLWLISHKNIFEDLEEKGKVNPAATIKIIDALKMVFDGREPDNILSKTVLKNPKGEPPDLLLKVYKWIWGQEDCNYPPPLQGRDMSMKGILELKKKLQAK